MLLYIASRDRMCGYDSMLMNAAVYDLDADVKMGRRHRIEDEVQV